MIATGEDELGVRVVRDIVVVRGAIARVLAHVHRRATAAAEAVR